MAIENVASYRHAVGVTINVDGFVALGGDIAWGGNWFFLTGDHRQELAVDCVGQLTDFACRIRQCFERDGIRCADEQEIDHVELFGPPGDAANHSRNFVLCPGGAYDRSPCGTGTSAKLACLAAEGQLRPGEPWRQEGILGTVFEGSYQWSGDKVIPTIRGSAFITAFKPFRFSIPPTYSAPASVIRLRRHSILIWPEGERPTKPPRCRCLTFAAPSVKDCLTAYPRTG